MPGAVGMARIMHVIPGLHVGGAETMLQKLLSVSRGGEHEHEVVSMTDLGIVGRQMLDMGVLVHALGMRKGHPELRGLYRLIRLIRERSPDLIQTWMYHADLLGGVAARVVGVPVIWGIRCTDIKNEKMMSKIVATLVNPFLSRFIPDSILCCADEARRIHEGYGYRKNRLCVIPNGFDTNRFRMDEERRSVFRSEIGMQEDAFLIGTVGRLHPMKDHRNFILAAAKISEEFPSARFVLCGEGLERGSGPVEAWIREAGGESERFILLGRREKTEEIYPAMDVNVLCSCSGEGFPNVLGEAMSCGVPCVATNVGDSAVIIGDTGRIVPPEDSAKLAEAIAGMLRLSNSERRGLGEAARKRIADRFSIESVVGQYNRLYQLILSGRAGRLMKRRV